MFEGLQMEVDNLKDDMKKLGKKMKDYELKVVELENRSHRNNLVIFNLAEGKEGSDVVKFMHHLLAAECSVTPTSIQRAHRSGKLSPDNARPSPIHIGFASYSEKEQCRKALLRLFKSKKVYDSKLYVSNDFSQQMRKQKLGELYRLREQGKEAFMVYPATIKIRSGGRVVDA